jgi:hypothetical protein
LVALVEQQLLEVLVEPEVHLELEVLHMPVDLLEQMEQPLLLVEELLKVFLMQQEMSHQQVEMLVLQELVEPEEQVRVEQ